MKKVSEIIADLREGKLENPGELSDYLVILSASLQTAGGFELDADIDFGQKWGELRLDCKTDRECDMKAKQTQEYRIWKQAVINNRTIQETIRALKKKLDNLQFEFSQGQHY